MQVFDVLESVKEFQVDQAALRDTRFVGMLPASELAGYFQSSLGANRIKFDSFGLAELEAMRQQLEAFSHPIYPRFVGDDAGFVAHVEQRLGRKPPTALVIDKNPGARNSRNILVQEDRGTSVPQCIQ